MSASNCSCLGSLANVGLFARTFTNWNGNRQKIVYHNEVCAPPNKTRDTTTKIKKEKKEKN